MEQYKPPGMIKKIYFHKLTFGDDPFRVEGIRVEEEGGQLQIDVSATCASACFPVHWKKRRLGRAGLAGRASPGSSAPCNCAACMADLGKAWVGG